MELFLKDAQGTNKGLNMIQSQAWQAIHQLHVCHTTLCHFTLQVSLSKGRYIKLMALKYTGVYSLVVVLTIFNEKAYLTKNVNLPKGWLWNHAQIHSWNQPVLSNEGKVSCSRTQQWWSKSEYQHCNEQQHNNSKLEETQHKRTNHNSSRLTTGHRAGV